MSQASFANLRRQFHGGVLRNVLRLGAGGVPNNADRGSRSSTEIAKRLVRQIGGRAQHGQLPGQTVGGQFEAAIKRFLEVSFNKLAGLRPGQWEFALGGNIGDYEQYQHLREVRRAVEHNNELRVALGDYIVKPDVVVSRRPVTDAEINKHTLLVHEGSVAKLTPLRRVNSESNLLHASVSCKSLLSH